MPKIACFEDMDLWQQACLLVLEIYAATKHTPFASDFPRRDHIRKSAISILSNIAEGFERGGTKKFIQFLSMAKGSTGELRAQMFIAFDQHYLTPSEHANLDFKAKEIG
jgi:four helix bundle protein